MTTMLTDALVLDGVRTPIGKVGGALSGVRPDDLAATAVRGLLERHPDLDPETIEEVYFGDANGAGEDNRNVARMAVLLGRAPGVDSGGDGQPPLWVGPRGGE